MADAAAPADSPAPLPPSAAPTGADASGRVERERDAADRLSRIHGERELHAVLLALLMAPGSQRALRAWQAETVATPDAEALRRHAASLSGAARLPWFELLLSRTATQPLAARQELLQATRRVMGARGVARPIDRLHWLTMRRGLGEISTLAARPESSDEAPEWLESDALCIATYTAFLSRMVPGPTVDSPDGRAWYDIVMATWLPFAEIPACQPPKAEAMVEALTRMQTLSWMQRPVMVRSWVTTAISRSRGLRLADLSADALRLTCGLLDSPQPPELARHYITLPADGAR
ncbi:MAG TPA: hypothetical protein VLD35_18480 [Caldimonas sp.]|nr:hypothetical protein [Caldimonas sp.]